MRHADYLIEFARELGALNGNNSRRATNTVNVTVTPQGGK